MDITENISLFTRPGDKFRLDFANRDQTTIIQESITSAFISSIAIIENFFVLLAVYRNPHLRRTQLLYVSALALGDFSMNLALGPPVAYSLATGEKGIGDFLCSVVALLGYISGGYTYLIICLMAVQRYCKLMNTRLYVLLFARNKVKLSIVLAWVVTIILFSVPVSTSVVDFHPGFACCFVVYSTVDLLFPSMILALIVVSALLSHFCYIKIWRYVVRHRSQMASSQVNASELKTSFILLLVMNSFSICMAPFVIVSFTEIYSGTMDNFPRQFYLATTNSAGISSCVNPMIYAIMSPQFKQEFLLMLGCRQRRLRAIAAHHAPDQKGT